MGNERCLIRTSIGNIRGKMEKGVYSFKGIPFALPFTLNSLFSPPEEVSSYPFTIEATRYGEIPFQRAMIGRETGFESLNLNIWIPVTDKKDLPVFFFVHGGSFFHGSGSESLYNGANLCRNVEIIVVTINYRVGVYGFLDFSSLDHSFSSNNGVRDVICALSWVHNHIASFSGDPDNITLAGQSAGGTLVSSILPLPQVQKLFKRALIMSGGPTQLQSQSECLEKSSEFLDFADISCKEDLLALDPKEMRVLQRNFMKHLGQGSATFRITVDGELIEDPPIIAAQKGKVKNIPLVIGTTESEMGFLAIKALSRFINVEKIVQEGLNQENQEYIESLKELYASLYGENRVIPMLYTDLIFKISSVWFAQVLKQYNNVHLYRFDFETVALKMNGMHAIHSTDLPYLFGNFSSAIVRPMFLLQYDMESVYTVAGEIQRDLLTFMKGEEGRWPELKDSQLTAMCYKEESALEELIPSPLADLYRESAYYRSSHVF